MRYHSYVGCFDALLEKLIYHPWLLDLFTFNSLLPKPFTQEPPNGYITFSNIIHVYN